MGGLLLALQPVYCTCWLRQPHARCQQYTARVGERFQPSGPKDQTGITMVHAAKCRGIFWAISLLLLQAEYDGAPFAAFAAGDSPSATTMPGPGSAANPLRLSPSEGQWVNVTSNLAGMASECGNMSYVSAKPNEDLVIAGVAQRGLWGSRDGGVSWHRLGSNRGSATVKNRPRRTDR